MGTVYAGITLQNAVDSTNVFRGYITEDQVRQVSVTATVDTGTHYPVISEEIRVQLGLGIEGLRESSLANNVKVVGRLTEPVKIIWEDRDCLSRALVLPDQEEVLLGVFALEEMDLMVDPVQHKLVGVHGDVQVTYVRSAA
jgi:clan AA aspartic protease